MGEVAMSLTLEAPPTLLTGLEEASLYHDAGERGFFSLLWCDPRQEPLIEGKHLHPKVQKSYRLSEMPHVIEGLDQNRDTWISQAEFIRPNRRVIYLLRLNLGFGDQWNRKPV